MVKYITLDKSNKIYDKICDISSHKVVTMTVLWAKQSRVRISVVARDYFLLQNVQCSSGVHTDCCSKGTGYFPGGKQLVCDVDHSPPNSTEVMNRVELYLHSLLYAFMV